MSERQSVRRSGASWSSRSAIALAAISLAAYPASRLTAQVGYDPAHSPYHEAPPSTGPMFFAGYLGGGRGNVPVGVSDGNTWGVRYNLSFGSTSISLGAAYGQTTRRIVNPFVASDKNTSGLINCDVVLLEGGLQMAITGPKTWHGLAPYLGATVGAAIGSELGQDTSGYAFGTKLTFGPVVGTKLYLGKRVSLSTDFRVIFWRLSYPTNFLVPNTVDGKSVLALGAATNEWTTHPWISLGLGWAF